MVQPSKDSVIKIERNHLILLGNGNLTKDITKKIEIHILADQCDQSGDCTQVSDSVISNGCIYLQKMPLMRTGLGDSFTPRIRCPVRKGNYEFQVNASLDYFGRIPIQSKYRWKARIMPYEVLSATRKRLIWCIEGLLRILPNANRKH